MAYRIVQHVIEDHPEVSAAAGAEEAAGPRNPGTRHFTVLVNPDAPEAEQVFESFSFGMDTDWETAQREACLLLDAKYGAKPKQGEGVGTDLATGRR